MRFLPYFSETALTILLILHIWLKGMILDHSAKTASSKKFWFSSYCPKCLSANQIARFLKIEYLKNRLSVRADFLFGNSESWKEHDTNIFLWQDTLGACLGMPIPVPIVTHGANLRQNVLAKNGHFWGVFKFWQKSSPLMCTYYCWKWKYLWCCNFLQKPHVWEKSGFRIN